MNLACLLLLVGLGPNAGAKRDAGLPPLCVKFSGCIGPLGVGLARIARAFRLRYYELVKQTLARREQVLPCYAGVASAQIAPDGDVWACCVRAEPLGNLRDVDYDFAKIWRGAKADAMRRSIKNKECCCPLANAGYTNMLMHAPTLWRVGLNLLARK